jgi:hypothetical protein
MPTAVEDIMESVATGVLRALDARSKKARDLGTTNDLVRSGSTFQSSFVPEGSPQAIWLR